jgi:hypothetical protein
MCQCTRYGALTVEIDPVTSSSRPCTVPKQLVPSTIVIPVPSTEILSYPNTVYGSQLGSQPWEDDHDGDYVAA